MSTFRILSSSPLHEDLGSQTQTSPRTPADGETVWIDLIEQDEQSLELLEQAFKFHPLTIEDCLHFDQRPKLESYDGYVFLVVQGFDVCWNDLDRSDALELHLFIGKDYVVTVHQHPIPALESVWRRLSSEKRLLAQGADYLAYLIVDSLIDAYFPLLDDLQFRLDDLEDRILDQRCTVQLAEILDFKRLLLELRKILSPQRDVLAMIARRGEGEFSERVAIYFRDVFDHALRVHESVESARELISNIRDAHLWNASQRTNEIMKQLTLLSAIFLPLTFITGFFGQNFDALPFHNNVLMYLVVASCFVVPVGMLVYFIRSKWF